MRMFTLFAFFIAALAPTSVFAQARGRQHTPAILYPPPPESVKGLWDKAQVVVRARVETGVYAPAFGPAGFFALSHMRDPSQPIGSTRVKIPLRAQRIREFAGRTSIQLEELAKILRQYQ